MRKDYSDFQINYSTVTGSTVKDNSFFDFVELDDYACWVAANIDVNADQKIAELIVQSILKSFSDNPTMVRQEIKGYLLEAQKSVSHLIVSPVKVGLAIVVTDYMKMLGVATGNERIYHWQRSSRLMADTDPILELGVDETEKKSLLYDFSDGDEVFGTFIAKTVALNDGDLILIGSGGFWENIGLHDIFETSQGVSGPFEYLNNLKQILLGGREEVLSSYTIAAIFVNQVCKKTQQALTFVTAGLILTLGLFLFELLTNPKAFQLQVAQNAQIAPTASMGQKDFATYEQNGDSFVKSGDYHKALEEYSKAISCHGSEKVEAREALQSKLKITQMINDAENLETAGSFKAARTKYETAQKAALKVIVFEHAEFQKMIAGTRIKMTVIRLITKGDQAIALAKYHNALTYYKKAKKLAGSVGYSTKKLGLQDKIATAEAAETELTAELVAEQRKKLDVAEPREKESKRRPEKLQTGNEPDELETQQVQEKQEKEILKSEAAPTASTNSNGL